MLVNHDDNGYILKRIINTHTKNLHNTNNEPQLQFFFRTHINFAHEGATNYSPVC